MGSNEGAFHFDRHGRTYHLGIHNAEDLARVLELDPALWIATSAPVDGLTCDSDFLELVDFDGNGRIRTDELCESIRWLLDRLSDTSRLGAGEDAVRASAINAEHSDGARIRATAVYILKALGLPEDTALRLEHLQAFQDDLTRNAINGDGIVTPAVADDEQLRGFIADVRACAGGEDDRTGKAGITVGHLDSFLEQATAWLAWDDRRGSQADVLMPLGDETPTACDAWLAVKGPVDDYFARCRLAWHDAEAAGKLAVVEAEEPPAHDDVLRLAPLATVAAGASLVLNDAINPAFRREVQTLRNLVVTPLLGDVAALSEDQWQSVCSALAPHAWWREDEPRVGEPRSGESHRELGSLGRQRLEECLAGDYADGVRRLLEADAEVAERLRDIGRLRKLLLFHKHILRLANNFVSFPQLYDPQRRAMFEMGALVMDGRWFDFSVRVSDVKSHAKLAKTSAIYVMYVSLTCAEHTDAELVAVPATAGTIGGLRVGKRGVFDGIDGVRYDAEVVQIIENPISFAEALVAPFVQLGRFIGGKIQSLSGAAQKQLSGRFGKAVKGVKEGAVKAAQTTVVPPPPPPPRPVGSSRRDMLVGASVSFAALSSALAFITKTLAGLTWWQLLIAVGSIALLIFLPSAIIAGLKLRRRNLSAILEGCGWAINADMRLSRRQRRQFTSRCPYPADALGTPRRRWLVLVLLIGVAVALLWLGLEVWLS